MTLSPVSSLERMPVVETISLSVADPGNAGLVYTTTPAGVTPTKNFAVCVAEVVKSMIVL